MKIKSLIFSFIFLSVAALALLPVYTVLAQTADEDDVDDLKKQISKYEKKIADLKGKAASLSNEIDYIDSQVSLTELKIRNSEAQILSTQKQIDQLSEDIDDLEHLIDKLTESIKTQQGILNLRIRERYKSHDSSPIVFLFGTKNLDELIEKTEYLSAMEVQDEKLIDEMDKNKKESKEQKDVFEDKKTKTEVLKKQLENQKYNLSVQKNQLVAQQNEKTKLLSSTKNDEAKYQQLLSQAKAELEGIEAILSGGGVEDSGSGVKAGTKIANVIPGASCNSAGAHLHFAVKKNGSTQNPFNYLKSGVDYVNCSGSYCGSGDGDSFNPSGKWSWPLKGTIMLTQGYGRTWAVRNTWVWRIYSSHDGIDIDSSQRSVYAVSDGTFYKGTYTGSNGCSLRYVRVDHKDGIQSYYLHVNY